MSNEHPEATRLAEWGEWFLKNVQDHMDFRWVHMAAMCAELRRQHAEIERLHEERFREAAEQQLEIEQLTAERDDLRLELEETIRQREIAGGAAELVRMRRDDLEKECADLRASLLDLLDFVERHSNRWDGVNGKHPHEVVEAARAAIGAQRRRQPDRPADQAGARNRPARTDDCGASRRGSVVWYGEVKR